MFPEDRNLYGTHFETMQCLLYTPHDLDLRQNEVHGVLHMAFRRLIQLLDGRRTQPLRHQVMDRRRLYGSYSIASSNTGGFRYMVRMPLFY